MKFPGLASDSYILIYSVIVFHLQRSIFLLDEPYCFSETHFMLERKIMCVCVILYTDLSTNSLIWEYAQPASSTHIMHIHLHLALLRMFHFILVQIPCMQPQNFSHVLTAKYMCYTHTHIHVKHTYIYTYVYVRLGENYVELYVHAFVIPSLCVHVRNILYLYNIYSHWLNM